MRQRGAHGATFCQGVGCILPCLLLDTPRKHFQLFIRFKIADGAVGMRRQGQDCIFDFDTIGIERHR
ncbi:MAG: hypothetical protein ACK55I_49620, partial [bacterium]